MIRKLKAFGSLVVDLIGLAFPFTGVDDLEGGPKRDHSRPKLDVCGDCARQDGQHADWCPRRRLK